MVYQKLILTFIFLLTIPISKFFFKLNKKNMRKRFENRNPKILSHYEKFNKINQFLIEKIFPIIVLIFLILFWFDIIKIPFEQ